MKTIVSSGMICVQSKLGITYSICKISFHLSEDETFQYIFEPNYWVMDLLTPDVFQGIPGLNLDLRAKQYVRENRIPTFISERVPSTNREDFYTLLQEVGMTYMDPVEYLIRTKKQYSGDGLFLKPLLPLTEVNFEHDARFETTARFIKTILQSLADGRPVKINNVLIQDAHRKTVHDVLAFIYARSLEAQKAKQHEGIAKARSEGRYKGRKPIRVESVAFLEMLEKVERKEILPHDAAHALGISIDKYYRLKKQLQK